MIPEILIALGVVAATALVMGILTALISHFFAVKEDETVKNIRALLPGINCGACGYKGCDDYAAAVAEGKAKPNLCIPGAEAVANELGALLGVEVEAPADVVAFVHCNGLCKATYKKADYSGVSTCKAASQLYGGPGACHYGCLGLGDCAAACPSQAICVKNGIARITPELCLGCGLCASVCPKHVISLLPQTAGVAVFCSSHAKSGDARKACQNACIGCRMCVKACEYGAVTVENNLAYVDDSKCQKCGKCAEVCPTGAMKCVHFKDIPEDVHPLELLATV